MCSNPAYKLSNDYGSLDIIQNRRILSFRSYVAYKLSDDYLSLKDIQNRRTLQFFMSFIYIYKLEIAFLAY